MPPLALDLAHWAVELSPTAHDLALAERSLLDVLAVTVAAQADALAPVVAGLPEPARWAALGHVLDFDDLHVESTTHVTVVCIPAALSAGGGTRAYLSGAGVMARLGVALGWDHYAAGWHVTCTAGAFGAAAASAVSLGLDADATARVLALSVPAAGGVKRGFGTQSKSVQVGFAADAGVRAARLAAAGATAEPAVLEQWLELVGGDPDRVETTGAAVPGGLAVTVHPCCYAMQRLIAAVRSAGVSAADVVRVEVRTPAGTVHPLIHARPRTGLEAKFSLEYAVATALLDPHPGLASFDDDAVLRPEVVRLVEATRARISEGGEGLLAGDCVVELGLRAGSVREVVLAVPPVAPGRPPSRQDTEAKVRDCVGPLADELLTATWDDAAALLRRLLPPATSRVA